MKRNVYRRRPSEFTRASVDAENAALRAYESDRCNDRVTEDLFDVEGEHAEVDIIVHRMSRTTH